MKATLDAIAQATFAAWFVDFDPVHAKARATAARRSSAAAERASMAAICGRPESDLDALPELQRESLAETAALFPAAFVASDVGDIPEGWQVEPLYETAEFINGAAFKASDFSPDRSGLPIVKIAELKAGVSTQTQFTTGSFPDKYRIDNDEVLYSWSGSPKTSLEVFKWFGGPGWLNQHIFKVVTTSEAKKHFVFFLLRQLKPVLISIATDKQTTGLGHVTVSDMKRLLVPCPTHSILERFSQSVGPLYESVSNLEKQSSTLADLRDALLPKLLSGELSVGQADQLAEGSEHE